MPYLCSTLMLTAILGSSLLSSSAPPSAVARYEITVPRVAEGDRLGQKPAAVTKANWRQHPKIKAVRAIVSSVNAGWKKGAFKTSERSFEKCGDIFTEFRRLTVDSKGVVRRYEFAYTAEDEGRSDHYYYDDSGRLRFVFILGSSGNGKYEHRIYFDEKGKRLWEDVKGAGHFWPGVWPDEELHKTDAAKDFADSSRCAREIKPKSKSKR